ncbi:MULTISPECIES: YlbF family regulator [unclassified Candidatus Frackibacter]|uniref:YlbF family regulator n=1 Tax=unclassified Candidatus Frackibacter TaxID=2648818 RepID=UPI00088E4DB5|nr:MULTISPECIES: YlbF family regulator [unclassified Candidatus Frackibacter]SDC26912.1 Cell fate regulator YlbF, YheA/YmcA/DUF963 family (controls sporulation, competence, biofilm development) [Candidatus Frackibacter sp. WG11]SEM53917.1 Cell fate regulator YlbF, YheA/YmcA/DUF963 family (controls sporulation, competence, biofilm development) [Candidatus Frackibacter sp. WG12]SFL54528.1 Cell fate regulator YlbF, YheA/YmcA/DUF963 family (controls sporulation, competence, biofilm development) [Can
MSIIEKAEALGEEIVDSAEYTKLKKAEEVMHSDDDAKALLDEFQAKQKQLQMAQMNGQQVTQEQQQELQALQGKMQQNESIKSFMEAQQQFGQVMESINKVLTNFIEGKDAEADAGGCC